jgi:hypothetical protein
MPNIITIGRRLIRRKGEHMGRRIDRDCLLLTQSMPSAFRTWTVTHIPTTATCAPIALLRGNSPRKKSLRADTF